MKNQVKRKKNIKTATQEQTNAKFDDWESNHYESLKNSSESEFEEDSMEKEPQDNQRQSTRIKKSNRVNFKRKVLKAEKKTNLLKLNLNLKQMLYDEFIGAKTKKVKYNDYMQASKHISSKKAFKICCLCFKSLSIANCVLCRLSICEKCYDIHPEINCRAYIK